MSLFSRIIHRPFPCVCLDEPQPADTYDTVHDVGVDETNGRYADVRVLRCKHCGRHWLHYQAEYEHFSNSGRYFMGLISFEKARNLLPEKAVDYLQSLEWHLYGGSYFGSKGKSTSKHIQAD